MEAKFCRLCNNPITGRHAGTRVFCSDDCARENSKLEFRKANPRNGSNVTSPTRGAISELRVATDLLEKGFEVFRAISPACSCDLAVLKNSHLYRIEVRTGYRIPSGKIMYSKPQASKSDVCAVVLSEEIIYQPDMTQDN